MITVKGIADTFVSHLVCSFLNKGDCICIIPFSIIMSGIMFFNKSIVILLIILCSSIDLSPGIDIGPVLNSFGVTSLSHTLVKPCANAELPMVKVLVESLTMAGYSQYQSCEV